MCDFYTHLLRTRTTMMSNENFDNSTSHEGNGDNKGSVLAHSARGACHGSAKVYLSGGMPKKQNGFNDHRNTLIRDKNQNGFNDHRNTLIRVKNRGSGPRTMKFLLLVMGTILYVSVEAVCDGKESTNTGTTCCGKPAPPQTGRAEKGRAKKDDVTYLDPEIPRNPKDEGSVQLSGTVPIDGDDGKVHLQVPEDSQASASVTDSTTLTNASVRLGVALGQRGHVTLNKLDTHRTGFSEMSPEGIRASDTMLEESVDSAVQAALGVKLKQFDELNAKMDRMKPFCVKSDSKNGKIWNCMVSASVCLYGICVAIVGGCLPTFIDYLQKCAIAARQSNTTNDHEEVPIESGIEIVVQEMPTAEAEAGPNETSMTDFGELTSALEADAEPNETSMTDFEELTSALERLGIDEIRVVDLRGEATAEDVDTVNINLLDLENSTAAQLIAFMVAATIMSVVIIYHCWNSPFKCEL